MIMKLSKSMIDASGLDHVADSEREERQVALEYVAEAWNEAEEDGVAALALAHASLFAAITSLVDHHGETAIADLIASLPERIQAGEYTLGRSLQ
jgi:predicted YcjX-like family ATPase